MSENHPHLYTILLIGIAGVLGFTVYWQWQMTTNTINDYVLAEQFSWADYFQNNHKKKQKPDAQIVKGLYLTAYSANTDAKRQHIIDLIDATELNAVVIDIKDYTGYVLYDSDVDMVNEFNLEKVRMDDVKKIINDFHEHNIYTIARQTVFQDPVLADTRHDLAFKNTSGGIWRDRKGLAWVNPQKQEIWDYNVAIAKEAIALGFDEVQFDYVRFPSDGDISQIVYTNGVQEKYDVMREFYTYMSNALADEPAYISLDLFGFVMERHDGMSIGQRLEDAVDVVDYISPMMYPSHYPSGHLGLDNPAAHPYAVIDNGMKKGLPYFVDTRAKVRPWIQAFNIGAVYGATNIRAQIDAIEKYPENAGWLLWNAANRYSSDGLHSESN